MINPMVSSFGQPEPPFVFPVPAPVFGPFTIIETTAKIYIFGQCACSDEWRLLKVDRANPDVVSLDVDTVTHSSSQMSALVDSIVHSNLAAGATVRSSACALLGFVRFVRGYYLYVATQSSAVAELGDHTLYRIESTGLIPLEASQDGSSRVWPEGSSTPSLPTDAMKKGAEARYRELFTSFKVAPYAFFSRTLDATISLQRMAAGLGGRKGYCWNGLLLQPPVAALGRDVAAQWFVRIALGYVGASFVRVGGTRLMMLVAARRNCRYAGPRFLKRGATDDGHVANAVEVEQSVIVASSLTGTGGVWMASHVQYRGSVPAFWGQPDVRIQTGTVGLRAKPPVVYGKFDVAHSAARRHYGRLLHAYGGPVYVLDLLKQGGGGKKEATLSKVHGHTASTMQRTYGLDVVYTAWDFRAAARMAGEKVVNDVTAFAERTLASTGMLVSTPHGVTLRQHGVVRTNCIDCLDRTNAAQFVMAKHALSHQLHALRVVGSPVEAPYEAVVMLFGHFLRLGDAIAEIYTGSQTVSAGLVHRGWSWDFVASMKRLYANSLLDANRLAASNVFVGTYRPLMTSAELAAAGRAWPLAKRDVAVTETSVAPRTAHRPLRSAMSSVAKGLRGFVRRTAPVATHEPHTGALAAFPVTVDGAEGADVLDADLLAEARRLPPNMHRLLDLWHLQDDYYLHTYDDDVDAFSPSSSADDAFVLEDEDAQALAVGAARAMRMFSRAVPQPCWDPARDSDSDVHVHVPRYANVTRPETKAAIAAQSVVRASRRSRRGLRHLRHLTEVSDPVSLRNAVVAFCDAHCDLYTAILPSAVGESPTRKNGPPGLALQGEESGPAPTPYLDVSTGATMQSPCAACRCIAWARRRGTGCPHCEGVPTRAAAYFASLRPHGGLSPPAATADGGNHFSSPTKGVVCTTHVSSGGSGVVYRPDERMFADLAAALQRPRTALDVAVEAVVLGDADAPVDVLSSTTAHEAQAAVVTVATAAAGQQWASSTHSTRDTTAYDALVQSMARGVRLLLHHTPSVHASLRELLHPLLMSGVDSSRSCTSLCSSITSRKVAVLVRRGMWGSADFSVTNSHLVGPSDPRHNASVGDSVGGGPAALPEGAIAGGVTSWLSVLTDANAAASADVLGDAPPRARAAALLTHVLGPPQEGAWLLAGGSAERVDAGSPGRMPSHVVTLCDADQAIVSLRQRTIAAALRHPECSVLLPLLRGDDDAFDFPTSPTVVLPKSTLPPATLATGIGLRRASISLRSIQTAFPFVPQAEPPPPTEDELKDIEDRLGGSQSMAGLEPHPDGRTGTRPTHVSPAPSFPPPTLNTHRGGSVPPPSSAAAPSGHGATSRGGALRPVRLLHPIGTTSTQRVASSLAAAACKVRADALSGAPKGLAVPQKKVGGGGRNGVVPYRASLFGDRPLNQLPPSTSVSVAPMGLGLSGSFAAHDRSAASKATPPACGSTFSFGSFGKSNLTSADGSEDVSFGSILVKEPLPGGGAMEWGSAAAVQRARVRQQAVAEHAPIDPMLSSPLRCGCSHIHNDATHSPLLAVQLVSPPVPAAASPLLAARLRSGALRLPIGVAPHASCPPGDALCARVLQAGLVSSAAAAAAEVSAFAVSYWEWFDTPLLHPDVSAHRAARSKKTELREAFDVAGAGASTIPIVNPASVPSPSPQSVHPPASPVGDTDTFGGRPRRVVKALDPAAAIDHAMVRAVRCAGRAGPTHTAAFSIRDAVAAALRVCASATASHPRYDELAAYSDGPIVPSSLWAPLYDHPVLRHNVDTRMESEHGLQAAAQLANFSAKVRARCSGTARGVTVQLRGVVVDEERDATSTISAAEGNDGVSFRSACSLPLSLQSVACRVVVADSVPPVLGRGTLALALSGLSPAVDSARDRLAQMNELCKPPVQKHSEQGGDALLTHPTSASNHDASAHSWPTGPAAALWQPPPLALFPNPPNVGELVKCSGGDGAARALHATRCVAQRLRSGGIALQWAETAVTANVTAGVTRNVVVAAADASAGATHKLARRLVDRWLAVARVAGRGCVIAPLRFGGGDVVPLHFQADHAAASFRALYTTLAIGYVPAAWGSVGGSLVRRPLSSHDVDVYRSAAVHTALFSSASSAVRLGAGDRGGGWGLSQSPPVGSAALDSSSTPQLSATDSIVDQGASSVPQGASAVAYAQYLARSVPRRALPRVPAHAGGASPLQIPVRSPAETPWDASSGRMSTSPPPGWSGYGIPSNSASVWCGLLTNVERVLPRVKEAVVASRVLRTDPLLHSVTGVLPSRGADTLQSLLASVSRDLVNRRLGPFPTSGCLSTSPLRTASQLATAAPPPFVRLTTKSITCEPCEHVRLAAAASLHAHTDTEPEFSAAVAQLLAHACHTTQTHMAASGATPSLVVASLRILHRALRHLTAGVLRLPRYRNRAMDGEASGSAHGGARVLMNQMLCGSLYQPSFVGTDAVVYVKGLLEGVSAAHRAIIDLSVCDRGSNSVRYPKVAGWLDDGGCWRLVPGHAVVDIVPCRLVRTPVTPRRQAGCCAGSHRCHAGLPGARWLHAALAVTLGRPCGQDLCECDRGSACDDGSAFWEPGDPQSQRLELNALDQESCKCSPRLHTARSHVSAPVPAAAIPPPPAVTDTCADLWLEAGMMPFGSMASSGSASPLRLTYDEVCTMVPLARFVTQCFSDYNVGDTDSLPRSTSASTLAADFGSMDHTHPHSYAGFSASAQLDGQALSTPLLGRSAAAPAVSTAPTPTWVSRVGTVSLAEHEGSPPASVTSTRVNDEVFARSHAVVSMLFKLKGFHHVTFGLDSFRSAGYYLYAFNADPLALNVPTTRHTARSAAYRGVRTSSASPSVKAKQFSHSRSSIPSVGAQWKAGGNTGVEHQTPQWVPPATGPSDAAVALSYNLAYSVAVVFVSAVRRGATVSQQPCASPVMSTHRVVGAQSRSQLIGGGATVAYGPPSLMVTDLNPLRPLLRELAGVDPAVLSSVAAIVAFWINVYHALLLHALLLTPSAHCGGVPLSPHALHVFECTFGYTIGGCMYTLSDIKHGILRGNSRPPGCLHRPFSRPTDPRRRALHELARVFPRYRGLAGSITRDRVCASTIFRTCLDDSDDGWHAPPNVGAVLALMDANNTIVSPDWYVPVPSSVRISPPSAPRTLSAQYVVGADGSGPLMTGGAGSLPPSKRDPPEASVHIAHPSMDDLREATKAYTSFLPLLLPEVMPASSSQAASDDDVSHALPRSILAAVLSRLMLTDTAAARTSSFAALLCGRSVLISHRQRIVYLPPVVMQLRSDFGGSKAAVLRTLCELLTPDLSEQLSLALRRGYRVASLPD